MLPDGFEIRSPAFEEVEDVTEMLVAIDLADTGTSESDADLIRDQWRGRGIASALLRRAFAAFASRGLPQVMLNVDSENSTGAVLLYESVGMRTVRAWDVYEKPVR
jgi:GNAT superfamily N-acetyltransferase